MERYMDQLPDVVAQNLRALRKERHLSLTQLAKLTGVSKSMLRQIEIGQSNPTVTTVWKIANGLRVPFTALMTRPEPEVSVQAFTGRAPLRGDSAGDDSRGSYRLYPLVLFDPQRALKVYYVEIDPGISLNADPHQGNTQEHVFVLHGPIEVTVDDTTQTVQTEHEIRFSANCPHGYHNPGPDMATAMIMISYLS
jgi:XRE family transcriptional regulator, regulator of sulfur utilization